MKLDRAWYSFSTVKSRFFINFLFFLFFRNALDHKFVGCPISIENAKYSRNALVFNVCFVLRPTVDTIRFEGVVKKLAGYMTSLEVMNPLHINISVYILLCDLYTWPKVLKRRICLVSLVGDYFLYYCNFNVWFRCDIVRRN